MECDVYDAGDDVAVRIANGFLQAFQKEVRFIFATNKYRGCELLLFENPGARSRKRTGMNLLEFGGF